MRWFWKRRPVCVPVLKPCLTLAEGRALVRGEEREQLDLDLAKLRQLGWGEPALARYVDLLVSSQYDGQDVLGQAQCFGSPVFVALLEQELAANQPARAVLSLALRSLDLPDELSPNQEELLGVLSRIWPDLPPHDRFWQLFSELVHRAFPGVELMVREDHLACQVHQLRYVLSTYQTLWVREQFGGPGISDRQALVIYLARADQRDNILEWLGVRPYDYELTYDLTESSRLHNKRGRYRNGKTAQPIFPDNKDRVNLKILVNGHTEFLLTSDGELANVLDPAGTDANGIINGASFNYARAAGARHLQLDVLPVSRHDPGFRRSVIRGQAVAFWSPNRHWWPFGELWAESFFNPKGWYASGGRSSYCRVRQLAQELAAEIRYQRRLWRKVKKIVKN